jgi:hypothetical protein
VRVAASMVSLWYVGVSRSTCVLYHLQELELNMMIQFFDPWHYSCLRRALRLVQYDFVVSAIQ